jgi:hypothetical protein
MRDRSIVPVLGFLALCGLSVGETAAADLSVADVPRAIARLKSTDLLVRRCRLIADGNDPDIASAVRDLHAQIAKHPVDARAGLISGLGRVVPRCKDHLRAAADLGRVAPTTAEQLRIFREILETKALKAASEHSGGANSAISSIVIGKKIRSMGTTAAEFKGAFRGPAEHSELTRYLAQEQGRLLGQQVQELTADRKLYEINQIIKAAKPALAYAREGPSLSQFFPWPPPKPSTTFSSAIHAIPGLNGLANLLQVAQSLEGRFHDRGYGDFRYYAIGQRGFAFTTPLERIDKSGVPEGGNLRWPDYDEIKSLRVPVQGFNLRDYLLALFMAHTARYRIFVVIVSDEPFAPDVSRQVTADDVRNWTTTGPTSIGPRGEARLSEKHQLTILVYEFRAETKRSPKLVSPSLQTGHQHLLAAGIKF